VQSSKVKKAISHLQYLSRKLDSFENPVDFNPVILEIATFYDRILPEISPQRVFMNGYTYKAKPDVGEISRTQIQHYKSEKARIQYSIEAVKKDIDLFGVANKKKNILSHLDHKEFMASIVGVILVTSSLTTYLNSLTENVEMQELKKENQRLMEANKVKMDSIELFKASIKHFEVKTTTR